ncbi:unnamed protein product [Zymoseptoria tritici ST99CH_3D7]|uniref:Uncharacterized protein n=1 Tax=Zymoseptoria tritici (strain ST99CH_3D7) TaxID=1276538 RepID=A0A1X7RZ34_ZYMT9|nr:unnamed protein product [Zymoseptoria tritici ST99CH_3D7]
MQEKCRSWCRTFNLISSSPYNQLIELLPFASLVCCVFVGVGVEVEVSPKLGLLVLTSLVASSLVTSRSPQLRLACLNSI